MKFRALLSAALVSACLASPALALEASAPVSSKLVEFNLDPGLGGIGVPSFGTLVVDEAQGTVRLEVFNAINCPAGMMCPAVMPSSLEVELPLLSKKKDACGATVLVASEDRRPVDGLLETITIVDHATDVCKYVIEHMVEATYESAGYNRFTAEEFKTLSTVKGEAFQALQ